MIRVFDISYDEVGVIKGLWEKKRLYHENTSEYFKELYRSLSFEQRIKGFSAFSKETMKITVRGNGIGKELVVRHMEWMKANERKVIGVTVSQENESTIGFYRRLGFYPNTLYMQQK